MLQYKLKLQMISNYYETLELTPKASPHQIAENYKKLALRYHPKTSKQHPQVAAHQFDQLAEAFEVLSDPVKRAFFDKHGYQALRQGLYAEGKLKGGYRYAHNAEEIFQAFFRNNEQTGKVIDLQVNQKGSLFGHAFGGLQYKQSKYFQNLVVKVPCTLEELYSGTTKEVFYSRKTLNNDGRTTSLMHFSKIVNIKPGYSSTTAITFPGQGHQTVHGIVTDLLLDIEEQPHPLYSRKGDDLIYTHCIPLADALSCGSIQLMTLDFRSLSVSIDSIVSPRYLHQVHGQGFLNAETGKRGNLYIRFDIIFPEELNEQVREQLRSLLQ